MDIIKAESEITTEEYVEPFVTIPPPGSGEERKGWLVLKVVTKQPVTPGGFDPGVWIADGDPELLVYGRRLTRRGTASGAMHLLWWLSDRDDLDSAANVAEHVRIRMGLPSPKASTTNQEGQ